MARLLDIFVCDKNGYGLSGYPVKLYGGDPVRTDKNGKASLMAEGSSCSVYVDGRTAYEGSVKGAPDPIVWKIS